jgi:hypothetical protein
VFYSGKRGSPRTFSGHFERIEGPDGGYWMLMAEESLASCDVVGCRGFAGICDPSPSPRVTSSLPWLCPQRNCLSETYLFR